ncbi:hypothetical protein TNCV_3910321 [Trichonephila clavipes]|nr:hypothetical protein TNCV_3910321 [Trichonephila clavipes]
MCSNRMECRSSDIKIYPPMRKNSEGDGSFGCQTGKYFYVFVIEDTVDRVRDSFCISPDKPIGLAGKATRLVFANEADGNWRLLIMAKSN